MKMGCGAAAVLLVLAGLSPVMHAQEAAAVHCGVEMRNVSLHVAEDIVLGVRTLDGELVSRRGGPPTFDDPESYTLRLRSADLSLDAASLTNLLAQRAFNSTSSPVRDVRVSIEKGVVLVRGTLHKGISVPFTMTAIVSADEGLLRLHAEKIKAAGVPVKGLLDLLGVDVANLLKAPQGSGIRADGDDVLVDTAALLPPPRTEGRLARVVVDGARLSMRMTGDASPPKRPATLPVPRAANYVYFFGGVIRFGKLTMTDADMQLVDAHPQDPFDFFPTQYEKQLVAGYSRNTPRKGLQVFMPDYTRASAGDRLAPR